MYRDVVIAALALPLAIAIAPLALGLGAVWFLWRLAVYASATRGEAEIVGWTGEGEPEPIERALAHPKLRFVDHTGEVRAFTSRVGFNIYDDPPPTGPQPVRYHLRPFHAELDDKAHWFTGPALTIAFALLGSYVAGVWRSLFATFFGG